MNDEFGLEELFREYRAACPDPEPSANFMPALWEKIEGRTGFAFAFQRLARTVMAAGAALCLLLLLLNFASVPNAHLVTGNYTDALLAEHSAERTYYTEALRSNPPSDRK